MFRPSAPHTGMRLRPGIESGLGVEKGFGYMEVPGKCTCRQVTDADEGGLGFRLFLSPAFHRVQV